MRNLSIGLLVCASLCVAAPLSEEGARKLRTRIKETLRVPDPLPPLAPKSFGRFEAEPSVVVERVTYSTQFGLRVPALLYLPKARRGRIPALIVVNGHGGDKYSWYAFYSGILYARAGAAVLSYDAIGEGERNAKRQSGTRAHDKIEQTPEMARRMAGLLITDVMQAYSYLSGRPEVDPKRVAAMGYSLGSFILVNACAIDTRLRACVLVGGGNIDGPDGYWDRAKPVCTGIPYRSLSFLGDRPAVLYALNAMRGPTLLMNGTADTVVNMPNTPEPFFVDLRRRTAEILGSDEGIFETLFQKDVSHRPFFVMRPVAQWLERTLDFPKWKEAGIDRMGETHISEWARREGVALDHLYATEDREGGVMALGTRVPGLARDRLNVLGQHEWEAQKADMILESWVRKAAAAAETTPTP